MMSVMSMVLSDMKILNSEKVLKMSILHDWAESKIGDFMPEQIGYEKKSELENYAMIEILESLHKKFRIIISIFGMSFCLEKQLNQISSN